MKKYDNYKDSGVDWIGEIPSQWSCTKLKFHTEKIIDGAHFTPTYIDKSDDSIPFLRVTDLHSKEILLDDVKYIPIQEHNELIKRCKPEKGDLLLSKNGTIGLMKIIDWEWEFSIFVSLCLLKFEKSLLNKFFYYFFESNIVDQQLFESSQKTSVSNLHLEKIKELRLTLPPISEQTTIANYLDHKTTQIEHLIAKKEQFIQLLEEERVAVINQAVTKGLDPTVSMKDSGIDWLGEIPAHWEVKKLKYFANVVLGKMLTNEDKGGYQLKPYLRAKNIEWINPNVDDVKEMWFSENEIIQYRINENDLLVSEGGEVGRTCIWKNQLDESYIQNSVHKVTILEGESNYFLNQFVLFGKYGHFDAIVNKISIAHLTKEKLKDLAFIVPTIDEQLKISKFITDKTSEIDTIILKSKQEIELLKEYKTALISEVVTGKVDVSDEVLN